MFEQLKNSLVKQPEASLRTNGRGRMGREVLRSQSYDETYYYRERTVERVLRRRITDTALLYNNAIARPADDPSDNDNNSVLGTLRRGLSSAFTSLSRLVSSESDSEDRPSYSRTTSTDESLRQSKEAELRHKYSRQVSSESEFLTGFTLKYDPEQAQLTIELDCGDNFMEELSRVVTEGSIYIRLALTSNGRCSQKKLQIRKNGVSILFQTAVFDNIPLAALAETTVTLKLATKRCFRRERVIQQDIIQATELQDNEFITFYWRVC